MRRIFVPILLIATLTGLSRPAGGQPRAEDPAIDEHSFVVQLEELSARVSAATAADVPSLVSTVPAGVRVTADDREFHVRFDAVVQRLTEASAKPDAWPTIQKEVAGHLAAMRAEAASHADAHGSMETADLRAALDSVLARAEFQRAARRSWTAELRERLAEWLRDLWSRLGGDRLNSRRVGQVLAWLAVLAAVTSILWFLRGRRDAGRTSLGIADGPQPVLPSRDWARRALAAGAAGDSREAVRCAYRAAVRRVEEQGGWRTDDSRTPREYGALFTPGDARATSFRAIARHFELAWFGRRPLSADDLAIVTDSLERLGCLRVSERAI